MTLTINEAQRDISRAFVGGGPGVFVSAMAWFAAAYVEATQGIGPAFIFLFFAGMLIFPLSLIASRFLFGRAKEASGNPLGMVALESTVAMIGGLFAAWLMLRFEPAYVFPLAAIAVGTHYAVFKTVYGDRLFWLLGALITGAGLISIFDAGPLPGGLIAVVGIIELLFAIILTMRDRRAAQTQQA